MPTAQSNSQEVWRFDGSVDTLLPPIPVFSKLMGEIYDQSWYGKVESAEIDFFTSHIAQKRTLEIGSGTGRISIPLFEQGCDLYGIEGSDGMLSILHGKIDPAARKRFILWNAMNTPLPADDQRFECVIIPFSTYGLLHNNVTDQLGENRLFHEIHRLLTPGGVVIINDYRTEPFDRSQLDTDQPPWIHYHQHPFHGKIKEEQCNRFFVVPNRILPRQIIRERLTRLVAARNGEILEEFLEEIPIWDTEDFPLLGRDAGFAYVRGEHCHFHEDPSIHHVFRKPRP